MTALHSIPAHRLRSELVVLGMDHRGSRADLINNLKQAGIFNIDCSKTAEPSGFIETKYPNYTNVCIGYGCVSDVNTHDEFIVQNSKFNKSLLSGNFETNVINLPTTVYITNTDNISPNTQGQEGDIRRCNENLYMYRSTNVHPGWYLLIFGNVLII